MSSFAQAVPFDDQVISSGKTNGLMRLNGLFVNWRTSQNKALNKKKKHVYIKSPMSRLIESITCCFGSLKGHVLIHIVFFYNPIVSMSWSFELFCSPNVGQAITTFGSIPRHGLCVSSRCFSQRCQDGCQDSIQKFQPLRSLKTDEKNTIETWIYITQSKGAKSVIYIYTSHYKDIVGVHHISYHMCTVYLGSTTAVGCSPTTWRPPWLPMIQVQIWHDTIQWYQTLVIWAP